MSRRRALAALAGLATAARPSRASPPLVVGSKIDTEGAVLGELITATLRAHGVAVQTHLQLGPTRILRQALLSGAIDLYPEYTGNGAAFSGRAGEAAWHEAGAAYRAIRDWDWAHNRLVWLPPAPADNGWGIAVGPKLAHLADLDGLARYLAGGGGLKLAASVEFVDTPDALPAFERAYGFRLRQDQILALAGGNTAATLRACAEGVSGVNAAMAYGTDGALAALGLVLLADPRHAEIVFQPAPVVRADALAAHGGVADALAPLFAGLDRAALQRMNAAVVAEGRDPAEVAAHYLHHAGAG